MNGASAIVSAWLPPAPGTASATYSDTSSSSLRKSQPSPVNELIQMIATKFDSFDPAREDIKLKDKGVKQGGNVPYKDKKEHAMKTKI